MNFLKNIHIPNIHLLLLLIGILAATAILTTHARKKSKKTSPAIGSQAPDFSFTDADGTPQTLYSLLKKNKKIALCFYPKDGSPFCTKQLCSLRDDYALLKSQGITVIGVSTDTEKTHKQFKEKHDLPFILINDEDKKIARLYKAHKGLFGTAQRKTILIQESKGHNLVVGVIKKVRIADHAQQIIDGFSGK